MGIRKSASSELISGQRLPQRRRRAIEETVHPVTLASGIVISPRSFARPGWLLCTVGRSTSADGQVAALIACVQLAIQADLDTHTLPPHSSLDIFARDLKVPAGERERIVIGDDALFDVA